jgi:hypothetical protein
VKRPFAVAFVALASLASLASAACARRPAMCSRTCGPPGRDDASYACVSGECLRAGAVPAVGALDRFGMYQARRLVLEPIAIARLAPGDRRGELAPVATLGRTRDAGSMLLLRFALDLPPGTSVLEAHVVLDRAPSTDTDTAPVALRAARIVDPWDARSIAWGRAPRLDDAHLPVTTIDDPRAAVRLDVGPLVRRWRRHEPDDQGIAIVADRTSPTGIALATADEAPPVEDRIPVLPVRRLADSPPTYFAPAEAAEGAVEPAAPRAPRLELYVRP